MDREQQLHAYWKQNLRYIFILLSLWATVSFVLSILLVDVLDKVKLFGFPLGFWFANQGSLVFFCVLVLVYNRLMNRLDHRYDVYED